MSDEIMEMEKRASVTPYEWASMTVHLGLILSIAVLYKIELDRGFGALAVLTFFGFLIHPWLPLRHRLPFFLALTASAIGYLLRWDGIVLILTGCTLIALCHLRLPWLIRVGLILVAGGVLAAVHLGWSSIRSADVVIPVLGAMFMFRIVLYLYDLKDDPAPATPLQRVAYFFLLPNVSFPLFPVVDYRTFIRTYYDAPAEEIYRKGLMWIYRGVGHLLLYRVVYYLLPRADSDLTGVFGLYVFMAMTYALYLRVSGLFHLIIGILCLFGFNLPRTNNNYFLATSFTDLWRRINIYWKDFMMTSVFYPLFMAVRQWTMTRRLMFATAVVFVVTWFLHSYQWFWLQGVFPIAGVDIAFWGFLGLALTVNSIYEARRGRQRVQDVWTWRAAFGRSVRALGVFSTMAMLWTLWYSDSFVDWGYRILRIQESRPQDWGYLGLLLIAIIAGGVIAQRLNTVAVPWERVTLRLRRRAADLAPLAAVILLVIWSPVTPDEAEGSFERVISRLRSTEPNRIDRERQERGYYEVLSRSTKFDAPEGDAFEVEWVLNNLGAKRETNDLRGSELVPGARVEWRGSMFSVNRWGMRDREYEISKPPLTHRSALLGASYEMGSGVSDHETFENLVEDRLNRELAAQGEIHYEILNFGVGGYSSLQMLYIAERTLADFDPDVVMYVIHPGEKRRILERLHLALGHGATLGPEYGRVADLMRNADAGRNLPRSEFVRRMDTYGEDLLRWTFKRQAEVVRAYSAVPVFVFLPLTDSEFKKQELVEMVDIVSKAGAIPIVLEDPYSGQELERIRVADWDNHPNALGHSLIADRLYASLLDHGDQLGLSKEGDQPMAGAR